MRADAVIDLAYPLPYVVADVHHYEYLGFRRMDLWPTCLDDPAVFFPRSKKWPLIYDEADDGNVDMAADVPSECLIKEGDKVFIGRVLVNCHNEVMQTIMKSVDPLTKSYLYMADRIISQRCLDCPLACTSHR